jgi:hypothetical protein
MEKSEVLAKEYGYLDHKYNLGFNPRPSGFESQYEIGYGEWRKIVDQTPEIPVGSYSHPANWGWY